MNYDSDKLARLEERAEQAAGDRDRWREKLRDRQIDMTTAESTVIRAVTSGRFEMDPPQRFRTGHNSGTFLAEYRADPRNVLALFEKESQDHDLLHPMRHHISCIAAYETAKGKLAEVEQSANHYLHLVRRCQEFVLKAGGEIA